MYNNDADLDLEYDLVQLSYTVVRRDIEKVVGRKLANLEWETLINNLRRELPYIEFAKVIANREGLTDGE